MEQKNLKEEILRISGVNPRKCMKCGKCSGTCPSYDEMEFHPHQFVGMVENGDIEPLLNSESLYKCLSCFACVERCKHRLGATCFATYTAPTSLTMAASTPIFSKF